MSTVVVLNVNHTGNGNASWKASPEKIRNVKYIVTEKMERYMEFIQRKI